VKPETREKLRSSLGAYYLAQNRDFAWYSFQQNFLVPALHRVVNHQIEALLILIPFRHAKTELATKNLMAWAIGKHPKRSNMLISYSDTFAKRFGRRILELCETSVHRQAFPECQISRSASRSGSYFKTTLGGEFFSAGFGGTITGQGVNGVLDIDDPIKNKREAKSRAIINQRMDDYNSTVKTRLEGGSRLLCTTRWCRGDFVDMVLDQDGEVHQGGDWTVLKVPAEAEPDDPLGRPVGQFLWPERLGERWYRNHKKKPDIWFPMLQQSPRDPKGKRFKREWLWFYSKAVRPGRLPTYMITDPALGTNWSGDDPTAIGVFCTTPDKKIVLVDGALDWMDPDQRTAENIRLLRKWKPRRWLYEELGLSADTWYLTKACKQAGVTVHPIPVGRRGPRHMLSKEQRIEELEGDFRSGLIGLPDPEKVAGVPRVRTDPEDVESVSLVEYFVEKEYCEYAGEGSVAHDDLLDMMSRLHEPELGLQFPAAEENTDGYRESQRMRRSRYRPGTSWEGVM
jgi:hypothetical protein